MIGTPREPCGFEFDVLGIRPHPAQRALLLLGRDREVLFGGSAGSSKSMALVLDALAYVDVPNYSALLLRRTYPELAGGDGLIERCEEVLGHTDAVWHSSDLMWEFPSGAKLRLGHAENDDDRHKFSGHAFQFVGVDELTAWKSPKVYLHVGFSRVRKPAPGASLRACPTCGMTLAEVPLRTRAATNPGGPLHEWVRSRWRIQLEGEPDSPRLFMPATIADNPSLDRESYEAGLAELDPLEKARLLDGDWSASEGGLVFERSWFDTVSMRDVPLADCELVRFYDLAATRPSRANADPDWTAGVLLAVNTGRTSRVAAGQWYVLRVDRIRDTPAKVEDFIWRTHEADDLLLEQFGITGSVPIRIEQEGGSGGSHTIDQLARGRFVGIDLAGRRPKGSKAERARPVAIAAEAGNVHLVEGAWHEAFVDELQLLGSGGAHDDMADALSGAFNELAKGLRLGTGVPVRTMLKGNGYDEQGVAGAWNPMIGGPSGRHLRILNAPDDDDAQAG